MQSNKHVYKIVITGGPCAGKTTAMNIIKEKLGPDYRIYTIPEAATMTFSNGVTIIPSEYTVQDNKVFNKSIMQFQIDMEKYFENLAILSKKKVVILCDRGVKDNLVYCMENNQKKIYEETGWTKNYLMDERYDMVIHLVTAANGASEYYTLENNAARSESKEDAIKIDKKTQEVWMGHPRFTIIDNSSDGFQNKLNKVVNSIRNVLGLPSENKLMQKYLLKDIDINFPNDLNKEIYNDKIDFLISNKENSIFYLKKRISNESKMITFSHIRRIFQKQNIERYELIRTINEKNYFDFLRTIDESKRTLNRETILFVYKEKIMTIETTFMDEKSIKILKITSFGNEKEEIPEWLEVEKNITEDQDYSSHKLAEQ